MPDFLTSLTFIENAFARGGGGGSGSGGSGGGGIIELIVLVIIIAYFVYKRKQKIKKARQEIELAEAKDGTWEMNDIKNRVDDVFYRFQKDWSSFNVEAMKEYLSDSYYKRMVLEMNVLKNQNRKNEVGDPKIKSIEILEVFDSNDNSKDQFIAEVKAQANDVLWDTKENKKLFTDSSTFTEYWQFVRFNNAWKLNIIKQSTETEQLKEKTISEFASRNGFFYDPDFGWLMMPNKGAIFRKSNFKVSDINNHVIGYYRDKIVEFYTFRPYPQSESEGISSYNINQYNYSDQFKLSYQGSGFTGFHLSSPNYVVAQTVLPIEYRDILVRRKRRWFNFSPRGLRRIHTESNEFERKFCLWADPQDQVRSFELLTPNFMAKVYDLPFELNIEIVGKFLYFYAKSRKDVDYEKMLEIISWAFDEMKK